MLASSTRTMNASAPKCTATPPIRRRQADYAAAVARGARRRSGPVSALILLAGAALALAATEPLAAVPATSTATGATRHGPSGKLRGYAFTASGTEAGRQASVSYRYRFKGVGDFDGTDDLLFRHPDTGEWLEYLMHGTRSESPRVVGMTRNTDYRVFALGDFDGDGADDVLLRHARTGAWISYRIGAGTTVRSPAPWPAPA